MKKLLLNAALVSMTLLSCSTQPRLEVSVENPLDLDRNNETVEIDFMQLQQKLPLDNDHSYIVLDDNNTEIPSQTIYEGMDTPQKFIFQADVKAKNTRTYTIIGRIKPEIYKQKTHGRFAPERYDDYIWENDRVAFRIYGLALIEKDGPSNGLDAIMKRTENLFLDKIYKDYTEKKISYHVDHGEGADCYKVGRSLGDGAMAPYVNNTLWLGFNFSAYETLDNGPVRTSFRLGYDAFNVNNTPVKETRIISLDAGSQMNKIIEIYNGLDGKYPVAAGIVLKNEGKVVDVQKADPNHKPIMAPEKGYIIYSEVGDKSKPDHDNGIVYTAVVFPEELKEAKVAEEHVLAIVDYAANSELTYYAGAGWSKWGFETAEAWDEYVQNFALKIRNPLKISF